MKNLSCLPNSRFKVIINGPYYDIIEIDKDYTYNVKQNFTDLNMALKVADALEVLSTNGDFYIRNTDESWDLY